MTTSTATYDPVSTAQSLAKAYTDASQTMLTTQTTQATNTGSALTQLQSALSAFDTAVTNLGSKSSKVAQSARFSDSSIATATASAGAVAGSYSFYVQQLATASQVAYQNLSAIPIAGAGPLVVNLANGSSFNVDLTAADTDGNGSLTPTEIAAAINKASGNSSLVTASVVTVNGQSQMVLSANNTGAGNAVSLDASGIGDASLKSALGSPSTLVTAQDAIVWLGAQNSGLQLQQASNTYTAIAGVSMTFKAAMASGAAPATLTVATDTNSTTANVQAFVDAYNKVNSVLDSLTSHGDPSKKVAASIFAEDAGVNSLRTRLQSAFRQSFGGLTLANFGVTADSDGTLSLDASKLTAKLATNPTGLDTVLGTTGTTSSGVLGSLDAYLNLWTGSSGQIKQRQTSLTTLQSSLTDRQTTIDNQYNSAYARYLSQFTQLQTLQAQMNQTSNLFSALFSSGSSS